MRNVESALRQAMEEDVAAVTAPPDLAGLVRTRHRRHRRRVRLTTAVAGVAAAAVVVPVAMAVLREGPAETTPAAAVDEVDGVELTYLPPGLRRGGTDGWDSSRVAGARWNGASQWQAVTGRWYPPDGAAGTDHARGLRVTVFRGSEKLAVDELVGHVWRWWDVSDGQPARPELQPPKLDPDGRVRVDGDRPGWLSGELPWHDVYWRPEPGVVLRVGGSEDLAGELEAVVDGIGLVSPGAEPGAPTGGLCGLASRHWPALSPGGGADQASGIPFPGVTVGYLPERVAQWQTVAHALRESGIFDSGHGTWSYGYRWSGPGDRDQVAVTVTCGEQAQEPAGLYRLYQRPPSLSSIVLPAPVGDPQPHPPVDGSRATAVEHGDGRGGAAGRSVQWLVRPGVVIDVYVSEGLRAELDPIVDGVDVADE